MEYSHSIVTSPPLSLAPMMDRTDRHFRVLCRLISRRTLLYTEMVVADAALRGIRERVLGYNQVEHPVALQLGGDDPVKLAECARIAHGLGYDEINLNIGCPSERVQSGNFGACLMREPELVARCVEAMVAAVPTPITVKHRIGVDDLDAYEDMLNFVDTVAPAGAVRFSVHARKAWLKGLSPKENRTIPPLRYEDVYRLKAERPHLQIEINGGIADVAEARVHLAHVDAVMIGRGLWDRPLRLAEADALFGEAPAPVDLHELVARYAAYAEGQLTAGARFAALIKPALNLLAGLPGTKAWKHSLANDMASGVADPAAFERALQAAHERALPTLLSPTLSTAPEERP